METIRLIRMILATEYGPSDALQDRPKRLSELVGPDTNRLALAYSCIEQEFGFQFTSVELDRIITIGDLLDVVARRLEHRSPGQTGRQPSC